MNRSLNASRVALPLAALFAVLALLAVVAGGALGRAADPSPAPSDRPSTPPSVAPSAPASPQPTAEPTVEPTDDPADGPITVDLDNLTDHDVSVVIDAETGILEEATSGKPGDGMSVRWLDVKVENLDSTTLRIVWVGLPRDEQVQLSITQDAGTYRLGFVQAAPPANSDAVGYDRILVLRFDTDVNADDVEVTFDEAAASAG
jgi:hypothetical protein